MFFLPEDDALLIGRDSATERMVVRLVLASRFAHGVSDHVLGPEFAAHAVRKASLRLAGRDGTGCSSCAGPAVQRRRSSRRGTGARSARASAGGADRGAGR